MSDRKPDQSNIVDELKELGRQLTATMRAVAGSEQVRSLGSDLKDGLREAAQSVEEAWDKVRERDEVQRLQAKAADVAESFKTGEAQQEIRQEVTEAIHALNVRLSQLLERLQSTSLPQNNSGTTAQQPPASGEDQGYTGETRRLG
ncbi:MAG TPA: hypothetical protein VGD58_17840 [Herpetosiphonaceae bacterium]